MTNKVYHVYCGLTGIYAGTVKAKKPNEWADKSNVTEEAIEAVRDWIIQDYIGGFDAGCHRGGREWTTKDGHVVRLVVEIEDKKTEESDNDG